MRVQIRIATPGDAAGVSDVLLSAYTHLMAGAYEPALMAIVVKTMAHANPALLASGTYYLAETTEKKIIGCGGWTRRRPGTARVDAGVAHLRHFATHTDWSGRGNGGLIYDRCERDARAAGVSSFVCHSSINAERFYAYLGFVTTGPVDIIFPGGVAFTCVRMQRTI